MKKIIKHYPMTGLLIVTRGYMDIRNNYAVITNLNVKLISTYPKISMLDKRF